ncbi:MAG: hypothetical protein M0T82_08710, partial [Desulfobacteraceae bacterium]|nr:hypothetical protein [Desulfobacteraceae bacterium]
DLKEDPIARFGIMEAQRHKERGISLGMFLGLMKYYRQAYVDLLKNKVPRHENQQACELFVNRMFDKIEIGFCVEWAGEKGNKTIADLQANNRRMTNEKNKYLTIFESIPNPVILLNRKNEIDNLNFAAVSLFKEDLSPGSQYYRISKDGKTGLEPFLNKVKNHGGPGYPAGIQLFELLPWLQEEVQEFHEKNLESKMFEKSFLRHDQDMIFRVKLSRNLDISGKFRGTIIILEDITSLKQALANVKQLSGLLPICSHCKKIRDDKGYWNQIEVYIDQHSEAKFSHGICQDCAKKYYPDYALYKDKP